MNIEAGNIGTVSSIKEGLEKAADLKEYLVKDQPIGKLEEYERQYKSILRAVFNGAISGEEARELAKIQKEIGLLLKYKSYTIKASNPLGYSIFFQNLGEGFSFQQHTSHKTEVFHILEVMPGGYVFICGYEDWLRMYDSDSFSCWLSGKPDARYDQYKYEPEAGDVFVLDQLGVVHSVVGCVLEEFATTSNDMVDRLHDQNEGKAIPNHFVRSHSEAKIRSISTPLSSRIVEIGSGGIQTKEIKSLEIKRGVKKVELAAMDFIASRYLIHRKARTGFWFSGHYAVSLCVTSGKGRLLIGDRMEIMQDTPPGITVELGDNVIMPPDMWYAFVNEGEKVFGISEHKIPPKLALF